MKVRPPRPPILRAYFGDDGDTDDQKPLHVNLFAGGGGASLGELLATGQSPDIAINHSPVAIAMHRANHPTTRHYIEDVYAVDPREATRGRRVRFLWMSPTCTHFSRAKGAGLKDQKIRGLAWSILPWIKHCRPDVIVLENVPEFLTWGPVCRRHADDCPGAMAGTACAKHCCFGRPVKERAGQTYRAWERKIRSKGYSFEARKLVAWEYGAPTTRERLYIVMRADGKPAAWPKPTHAREPSPQRPHRWRTAAEIIDWSIPCPSVFGRHRALVDKTEARLVRGVGKFVLECNQPFLVPVGHDRSQDVATSPREGAPVVAPYMIHRSNGERRGQAPRVYDVQAPHPTVVAGGLKTAVVTARLAQAAFLAKHFSERRPGEVMGSDLNRPISAVTAQDHHALVAASLAAPRDPKVAASNDQPHPREAGWSAALLTRYNGQSVGQAPDAPLGTVDTHDRYALVSAGLAPWSEEIALKARRVYRLMVKHGYTGRGLDHENQLVTVTLGGQVIVIYDLGMRMLSPRELFRAQGFDDGYVIDPVGPRGKRLTKTEQIRACGNSVCPPMARVIVESVLGLAA